MVCRNCGEKLPDPEPKVVVTEKVREVHLSDGYYVVRALMCAAAVLIVLILALNGVTALESYRKMRLEMDPNTKVEVLEYDYQGKLIKKITR